MQDPNIVGQLRKGDGSALKRLYRNTADRAYLLAMRMTGDPSTTNKVIQAVFEELWHKRKTIDPLQDLSSRILRETYVCVRELQKEKGVKLCPLPDPSTHQYQTLLEKLVKLEETEQLVYLLHTADGFSTREVARTLDISDEAATTLHARALEKLQSEVFEIGMD